MAKTAIKEAIEYLQKYKLLSAAIILENFLEKEKDQIIASYKQGCIDTYGIDEPNFRDPDDHISATEYYKSNHC